jgi:hypothetical protein
MTSAQHNPSLRLASPTPPPWDDRAFRWALRDSGLLAELKPAEALVLWQAYCMANAVGEFDLPIAWVARQLKLSAKAVSTARSRLEAKGLLQLVGTSDHSPQIGRYALTLPESATPQPRPSPHGHREAKPPAEDRSAEGPPPNVRSGDPGTCVPPTPERTFPQRGPEKSKEKETAAARAGGEPDQRGLFDGRPAYDAAAAAILVRHCRMSAQEAKGYVGQYRPTAANVRTIVANMAARDKAAALGQEKSGIRDRLAFTRSALRRGEFSLDDRVARIRAAGRRRAATAMAKRAHAREAAQRQHDAATAASANDQLWASLTDDDRRRLLDEAIKAMPPSMRRHFIGKPLETPSVRAAILRQAQVSDE